MEPQQRAGLWPPSLLPRQAGSSILAPPSGLQPQDTRAFHRATSSGFFGRRRSVDVRAWVQFQDPVLSIDPLASRPRLYLLLCFSPSHRWLCFLVPNEYFSVFKSGCGLLRTAPTQRAERRSTERSFPFRQHHSPGKTTRRKGLACSIPAVVLDGSSLVTLQGHSYSMY